MCSRISDTNETKVRGLDRGKTETRSGESVKEREGKQSLKKKINTNNAEGGSRAGRDKRKKKRGGGKLRRVNSSVEVRWGKEERKECNESHKK